MNGKAYFTKDYNDLPYRRTPKNKANSKPISCATAVFSACEASDCLGPSLGGKKKTVRNRRSGPLIDKSLDYLTKIVQMGR